MKKHKDHSLHRVLVLDNGYTPLTTVSINRAIVLILTDKADLVEAGKGEFHSAKSSMPIPSVIRIRRSVHVPFARRAPLTRRSLLNRDKHECCYCEKRKGTTIDHVKPRSKGGRHTWMNVVGACRPCNGRKGARTPEEAGMTMRFQPSVPSGLHAMIVVLGTIYDEWKPYLGIQEEVVAA